MTDSFYSTLLSYFPELQTHQDILEKNWSEAIESLDVTEREKYLSFLENYKPNNFIKFINFFYFLHSGLLYQKIETQNMVYLELGIRATVTGNPLLKYTTFSYGKFRIHTLYPVKSHRIIQKLFQQEYVSLFQKTVMLDSIFFTRNIYDYLESTLEFVEKIVRHYTKRNIPVTILHFHFYNLDTYIKHLGNTGTLQFLYDMDAALQKELKDHGIPFLVSYKSCLVVTAGKKQEELQESFKNLFLEVQGLYLDYTLYSETITAPHFSLNEILQKINL